MPSKREKIISEVQRMALEQIEGWERYKAEGHVDPNSIPDDVADAAALDKLNSKQ